MKDITGRMLEAQYEAMRYSGKKVAASYLGDKEDRLFTDWAMWHSYAHVGFPRWRERQEFNGVPVFRVDTDSHLAVSLKDQT